MKLSCILSSALLVPLVLAQYPVTSQDPNATRLEQILVSVSQPRGSSLSLRSMADVSGDVAIGKNVRLLHERNLRW